MAEENRDIEKKDETQLSDADQRKEQQMEESPNGEAGNKLSDEQMKKAICSLAYLFGILFFLPLILYPEDKFARFHANQACIILIVTVIGEVVFGILCGFVPLLGIFCGVVGLLVLIACIWAIIGVVKGEMREIPLLGHYRIIK